MKYRYDTVCGLYCGACPAIHANRNKTVDSLAHKWGMESADLVCHGCLTDANAVFCRDCTFKRCAVSRGVLHCFECDEFPCNTLIRFRNDRAAHHSAVLKNSERLQEVGVSMWLAEQKRRWSCRECGAPFTWYAGTCTECNSKLYNCRDEEAEIDAAES